MQYRVTMPRSSSFVVLLIGLTGVTLSLYSDPTFFGEHSVRDFSTGRWAALALTAVVTLFGLKGLLLPKELFACDHVGVTIPGLPRVVEWPHVRAIEKAQIRVGSSSSGTMAPIVDDAVRVGFDDSVELNDKGCQCSHGRPTDQRTYVFSTGVTAESVEQVIARIEAVRAAGQRA